MDLPGSIGARRQQSRDSSSDKTTDLRSSLFLCTHRNEYLAPILGTFFLCIDYCHALGLAILLYGSRGLRKKLCTDIGRTLRVACALHKALLSLKERNTCSDFKRVAVAL